MDRAKAPQPVWTWEIPTYFFAGGAAGAAALIALAARLSGDDTTLVRDARVVAVIGAALSPALLISDLGRPTRFLSMLRVFKTQSPMSVGAWTLVAFATAVFAGAGIAWMASTQDAQGSSTLHFAGIAADVVAALSGLVIVTYTGVLIGATAVPVWSQHASWLPLIFSASALGSAVSMLELAGHWTDALNAAGIGAAAMETLVGLRITFARRRSGISWPARAGRMAAIGALFTGSVPLVLRLAGLAIPALRVAAAVGTIGGALLTRIGWLSVGRVQTS